MHSWHDFRLVTGYLPEIDRLPDVAAQLGLLRRVALVLNDDDAPHSPLYWDLVKAMTESVAADGGTFEIDTDRDPLVFDSLVAMREHVAGHPETGRPFNRAVFCRGGRATAFINVEPWAAVGGPFPYSDSWTFAIYRETDDARTLRDACHRVCARHGLPVQEELQGLPEPRGAPWWKRLVRWLLR
jgi:hypothetical protein